jgi:type IV secretory pathway TrbF-like protein
MDKSLAATLGELQAQIYWLHDALEFTQLASTAATIYMKLGYTTEIAQTAGNLISQAYQLADDAADAQKAGDHDREMQFYHQAKDTLVKVETTLLYQTSIALHQMKWWMHFRHRQKLQVLQHLFLQNLKAVGLITAI